MALLANKRLLAKCRRNVKRLDQTYSIVTTPISLIELSLDDVPDQVPYRDTITHVMSFVPGIDSISSMYDTVSVNKDILESVMSIYHQIEHFERLNDKQRLILFVKCISFVYKTVIIHSPLHEHHTLVTNMLDYINFIVSVY